MAGPRRSREATTMKLDRNTMQRDPRALPELVPKNVSVPDTCEFYGARDVISQCRFPRSCHDCLVRPECSWSGYGKCGDPSSVEGYNDYRSIQQNEYYNQSYPYFGDSWVTFPATHTTYCAATDPVCKSYRHEFKATMDYGDIVGNQFCVGADGCVCVASCEYPQHVLLHFMTWSEPYCEPALPVATTKEKKLMAFTSIKRDPRAPTVGILSQPKEETCAYYGIANVQGNGAPRTCRDCLQREGCVIDGDNCVDMTKYNPRRDFRAPPPYERDYNYSQGAMFPSVNTTYCDALDPRCTRTYDGYNVQGSSQFFVGEGGCVCIQACESTLWAANAPRQYTPRDVYYSDPSSGSGEGKIVYVVGFVVFFTLVYHCYSQASAATDTSVRPQNRARRPVRLRHMVDEAQSLPRQLSLSGWRGYREDLVRKEHRFLQGSDTVPSPSRSSSSPTGSTVDYVDAATMTSSSPTQNAASTPHESDVSMRRSSSSRSSTT